MREDIIFCHPCVKVDVANVQVLSACYSYFQYVLRILYITLRKSLCCAYETYGKTQR